MHGQSKNKVVGLIVVSDGKFSGVSEIYLSSYISSSIKGIVDFFCGRLINKEVENSIETLNNIHIPFANRNGVFRSVAGAIYNSILDLYSKNKSLPLHKVLNHKNIIKNKPKIYASGGTIVMSPDEISDEIKLIIDDGFDGYKLRIANNLIIEKKRLEKLRNLDIHTMVDAISSTKNPPYSIKEIYKIMNYLEDLNIFWLEEPLQPDYFLEMNKLKEKSKIKLAAGEAYVGYNEFKNFIDISNFDVIQIDACHSGSYHECKLIVEHAKKKKKIVASHVWGSAISKLMNYHLAIAFNFDFIENPLIETKIDNVFGINLRNLEDFKKYDDLPGIGVDFDENKLENFRYIKGTEYNW